MLKQIIVIVSLLMFQPMFAWAESDTKTDTEQTSSKTIVQKNSAGKITQITMSGLDAIKLAGKLVDTGDYEHAEQILTKMPETDNIAIETERWYLIAQIFQRNGDYDNAIKIYRKLLDDQPLLAKIRYELALCYMAKEQWYRADFHLRLAMADNDIPDNIKQQMLYYRYLARKNKRWNVWFDFGVAPDTNANQASGGVDCITIPGFSGCMELPDPESAVGFNFMLGGNYEFVLTDHWHLKNEANIYTNIYNKHKFDDLYLSFMSGPKYVWERGDVWMAAVATRRWYGHSPYNWALGGRMDAHYDLTRRLSGGISLRFLNNNYDEYGEYMNGQTYGLAPYISCSVDSSKYVMLRADINRDIAKNDAYQNWRYTTGIGFGAEFPLGFSMYLEPSFSWVHYDGPRWTAKDNDYVPVIEKDFVQRYTISTSNNKFDLFGFVPTLTVSYTNHDSNIHSRQYEKWSAELSLRQKF